VRLRHAELAERVREVREDFFGESGTRFLADALGLPPETWANYERGVVIPADVILMLIETTKVSPHWLLTGQGPQYESLEARHRTGDD
jgi:Bacteriophage CI repressor helix-turn-helix domain